MQSGRMHKRSGRPRIHPVCGTVGCRGSLDTERRKQWGRCMTPACKRLVELQAQTVTAVVKQVVEELPTFDTLFGLLETRKRPRQRIEAHLWYTCDDGAVQTYYRSLEDKTIGYGYGARLPNIAMSARKVSVMQLGIYLSGATNVEIAPFCGCAVIQDRAAVLVQRWWRRLRRVGVMAIVAQLVAQTDGIPMDFWRQFLPLVTKLQNKWHQRLSEGTFANPEYDTQTAFNANTCVAQLKSGQTRAMYRIKQLSTSNSGLARKWQAWSLIEKRQQMLAFPVTHYYAVDMEEFPPLLDSTHALTCNAISLQRTGIEATQSFLPKLQHKLDKVHFTRFYPSYERVGMARRRFARIPMCIPMDAKLVLPHDNRLLRMASAGATLRCIATGMLHGIISRSGRYVTLDVPATHTGLYVLRTAAAASNQAKTFTGGITSHLQAMMVSTSIDSL